MTFRDDYMDLNNELTFDNLVIFISGTPCTGKTTIATELNDYLNNNGCDSTLIKINDTPKAIIVEGHLSHLCEGADKMIVLRLNPSSLKNRLEARDYAESKVNENLEAEALAVCSAEACELYDDELNEIDTTDKSIAAVLSLIIDVINDNAHYPAGSIDFMDWFLS